MAYDCVMEYTDTVQASLSICYATFILHTDSTGPSCHGHAVLLSQQSRPVVLMQV